MSNTVTTKCRECGTEIHLNFDGLSYEQALDAIEKMDRQARECPGFHTELSGWRLLWQLDYALASLYPEHQEPYRQLFESGGLDVPDCLAPEKPEWPNKVA